MNIFEFGRAFMRIETDLHRNGKTVLEILKKELRLSSKMITSLKKSPSGITVDGEHVTVRRVLHQGEVLCLEVEDKEQNENLVPTELPLAILYEDDDIIALNKPPHMPTHPSHGHFSDTLANGLCFYMQKKDEPFVFRSVNRLDRNTSGIVLVAKNRISANRLYGAMQKGLITKKYIALLLGTLPKKEGRIDTYIRRREKSIITREVCGALPDAARAITNYEVLSSDGALSAVKASPITGRTHQLRLHFAHLGVPILGDDLYGKKSEEISRQALHAYYLSFPHPKSGKVTELFAPLPNDMEAVLKKHNLKIEV